MNFTDNPAKIPDLGFTHAGRFHADDVFSAALLKILYPPIQIRRGFIVPEDFKGIVFDIGNGRFDHHAANSEKRENGTPYAAFGLLWRDYGTFILETEDAKKFDSKFIQPLDIDDNVGSGHVLANLIGTFNPSWDSTEDEDSCFEKAVQVAKELLSHKFESILAVARGQSYVQTALDKMENNIVVLEHYAPWKPVLISSKANFVVYPSQRGGFCVQCIPKEYNAKSGNKVPFPSEWYGKPAQELALLTGIEGFSFCHSSGFLATIDTLENAFTICSIAVEKQKKTTA